MMKRYGFALASILMATAAVTTFSAPSGAASAVQVTGKANAKLSTLTIGWSNQDLGANAFPGMTQGALAATKYINAKLGGIDGHPLKLSTCSFGTDDQSIQECGQQFANASGIKAAMFGINTNAGPYYSAMAPSGKVTLGALPTTQVDNTAQNTYFYYTGGADLFESLAKYPITHHAHTVAILYGSDPSSEAFDQIAQSTLQGTGIQVKSQVINATNPNVLSAVTASGASSAQVILIVNQTCSSLAQALQQVGAKGQVVALASCVSQQDVQQSPTEFNGWEILANAQLVSVGPGVSPNVTLYLKDYPKYGPKGTPGTFTEYGWGIALSLQKALIKQLTAGKSYAQVTSTAAGLKAAVGSFTGPVNMGFTDVRCGTSPDTALCSTQTALYGVSSGKVVPLKGKGKP